MASASSTKPETTTTTEISTKDGNIFPQPPNTTRELLVKWKNMSYRKVAWVPSYWVSQVVAPAKMKSFWKKVQGPSEISDVVQPEWTQVEKVLDVVFDADYNGRGDNMDALDHIQSVFVKWRGLDYDQATWDEPDEPDSPHYATFKQAFKEWVAAQKIDIPARAKKGRSGPQPRPSNQAPFEELKEQPAYISGGTLKDYQMDGLNWLRYNHWKNVNSILADEMGLGKTIQMVAFVTTLFHELRAFPCLIVVPNSTLTNWVREFAKWSPDLRVVAYYGPQTSRTVVREYELFHRGTHDLKCHVVVTTYEMIVNPVDSIWFRKNSWECLVVDEGQRLKNENSMLFIKLNELVVENRVLLTGTPLQNNIRELFSLMNFLDPVKFSDVTELEKKYENLDKNAVEELHGLLKPFFLRRTKDEVLKDLPPKSEVIVPVGMSALQKEIYKGILARNHKLLQSITNRGGTASNRKASLHNILMELRKCLNHPYLIEGVEPRYLDTAELVHKSLIEAGGKLELLHNMLPKLKQNGHRVLIFSTMTRLLDILEDYLNGEHYNFVRLDGGTSSADRQARIDKFNAPGSDVFVFLLSTRAGGVGVNLATADTIIIYDVDFNPKADMQALSRAHRIGQKNKVLVLKFMTRNSAEERIVQIGKKKMILDHLIVERMEDDNLDPVDVESILKFGAKALFEEDSSTNEDVKYDDAALDALLDRSKIEHSHNENDNGDTKVSGFGFAKVW
ncbi:P-loop containing nucleoside triphosphate hydrolase protein, partial [Lobosporangium transversale]